MIARIVAHLHNVCVCVAMLGTGAVLVHLSFPPSVAEEHAYCTHRNSAAFLFCRIHLDRYDADDTKRYMRPITKGRNHARALEAEGARAEGGKSPTTTQAFRCWVGGESSEDADEKTYLRV